MGSLQSSSLEQLLCGKGDFETVTSRPGHAALDTTLPAMLILQLLSIRCLLVLRLVSKTTKAWVEFCRPSLLSSLSISFPSYSIPLEAQRALNGLAQNVWQLKVMIIASAPSGEQPTVTSLVLPSLPSLLQLKIEARTEDQFQPVLNFRHTLQAPNIPLLESLVLENISIKGIIALRWGPFSSISSDTCRDVPMWRRITDLSVAVLPWWKEPKTSQAGDNSNNGLSNAHLSFEDKLGFMVLHDWLGSFSFNTLERLRFEWVGLDEGPNPLLLDQFAVKNGRSKPWMSAPSIQWKHLTVVRFKGVELLDEQMEEIKGRVKGLKKLLIETSWTETDIAEGLAPSDPKEWVEDVLDLEEVDEGFSLEGFLEGFSLASLYGKPPVMGKLASVERKATKIDNDRSAGSHGESFVTDWGDTSVDPFTSH